MSDTVLRKIYLSLYCRVCVWEGVGDRTEQHHIDPYSYGHQRCVFLVLLMLNRRPRGPTFCWLSLLHLVSNFSELTDFLSSPSYVIVQSPTQSLEWHVWSSSSGNNCHAVHRSLSSGASVYDSTMGFYLVPFFSAKPTYAISSHNCHRNVSLSSGASLWNGMFGRVESQYTTIEWNTNYFKRIYSSYRWESNGYHHSRSEWTWK